MIINPHHAINEGWITGIRDIKNQVQPNAIDFTLDRLFEITSTPFYLYEEDGKEIKGRREQVEVMPVFDKNHKKYIFTINPSGVYDGMSDIHVSIPTDIVAVMVVRSTFNRSGIFIVSGLYDSGFQGSIGFTVHNRIKSSAFIGQGTRIGQIYFMRADAAHNYHGGYNTSPGEHWTEATR